MRRIEKDWPWMLRRTTEEETRKKKKQKRSISGSAKRKNKWVLPWLNWLSQILNWRYLETFKYIITLNLKKRKKMHATVSICLLESFFIHRSCLTDLDVVQTQPVWLEKPPKQKCWINNDRVQYLCNLRTYKKTHHFDHAEHLNAGMLF